MKAFLNSRALTWVVGVVAAISLGVTLVAAGFAACAISDLPTKALASAFSDDADSPFTKDELVGAAIQTKHYTIDDNDAEALGQAIATINVQAALSGRAGKGAPDTDALQAGGENREAAFEKATENYVLNDAALSHLDDVYNVVQAAKPWLLGFIVAACVCTTAVGFRGGKRALGLVLSASAAVVIIAFAVAGIWAAVDFYGFFGVFHSLFFSAGTWTFPWDSLLICMYPLEFWMGMGCIWLGVTLAACVVCLIIGRLLRHGAQQNSYCL